MKNKENKIVALILIIGTLLIIGSLFMLNYKVILSEKKDDLLNTVNYNAPSNEFENTNKNTENLQLGNYVLNEVDYSDPTLPNNEGCGVTLKENNECYIYEGYGNGRLGVYHIQDNKVICNTIISKGEEGEISYLENNIIFTFELISGNTLKLINVENNAQNAISKNSNISKEGDVLYDTYGLSIGMTYTLKNENTQNTIQDSNSINGIYMHNYTEILEEGTEYEWKLELGMGFSFENNGEVYGFLPGHENGMLVGTYEIFDKKIKCKFTEYENECSAIYDLRLDNDGEVVLNILNENELSISSWNKKPILEKNDLSYGEGIIFKK